MMSAEHVSPSDALFYHALNAIEAHLAILNEHGEIIFTNTAWQNFAKRGGYKDEGYGLGVNYLAVCRQAEGANTEGALTACVGLERVLDGHLNHVQFEYPCPSPTYPAWYKATFSYIENTNPRRILVSHTETTQAVQTMHAYQENRLWLKHTLTSINEGVIVTDNLGLVEFLNPVAEALLEYQQKAVLGWPLSRIFALRDHTQGLELPDPAEEVLAREAPLTLPHPVEVSSKNGQHYFITCTAAPIHNQNGSILGTVISFRDITEQHTAEKNIKQKHDLLNTILETSITAITLVNKQGQIVFANNQAEKILGLSKDSITQLSYNAPQWRSTALDGGPWPDENQPFLRVMHRQKPVFDVRHAIEWPNGTRKYLSINGAPLFDEAGQIEQVVFAITDISAQYQAEEQLRQSEARLRAIFNSGSQATLLLKPNYHIADLNYQAQERGIQLYDQPHKQHKNILDYIPPHHHKEFKRRFETALQGQEQHWEAQVQFEDGSQHWFRMSVSPVVEAESVTGVCFTSLSINQRKRAELALQESEHRFRTLIQEIDIGILLLTTATEIIESNEAAVELLGLHKSELTDRTAFSPDWQIIREDGSPFPAEDLPVVRAAKEKKCFENVVMGVWRPKSADYVWLMVNAKPQSHTDGSLKYVICSFNDITRLKEAEYKIWQHNRELGVLNKVISTAISDHSPERILSVACETLAQLLNFPIASSFLISPDKRSERLVAIYELNKSTDKKPRIGSTLKHNPLLADILHHKKPLTIKNPHQHPQMQGFMAQRPHIQSLIIFPLVVKDEVLATLVFESDTPRTLTAEEEELVFNVITQAAWVLQRGKLIEEQRLLSAVIEQSMESIIITDTAGYITYVNPTFEKVSGYSQAETQGHTPRLIKSDYHPPDFYRDMWLTITAGKVWEGRFHNQAKDGRHYIDEATIAPLRNEDGDITHFISIQREVTAQLEMEMQLRQAQKMESLGQLTGGIAHDFNNILTAIMGHASLAHETLPPQHLALEDLKYIQENAERASNLTRQLLTFARRNHTEPKNVNINQLILNLDKMLRRLIGEDIEMSIFLAEDLGHIQIDPGQFEQVLVNLVVNARDAMPEGGPVVIRTQTISLKNPKADLFTVVPPGTYTVLSVNDQGIGMTQETLERIFEPFFTTKAPGRGTGLGLATSFGIIKQHQGYILVDSYPQQGSTFTVYFPQLNEAAGTKGTSAPDATFLQGQEQILVVEDEAIIRQLANRVLTQQGYTVLEASNGQQALSLLTAAHTLPDLLITDMVMPIMGGANLTEILRDRYPLLKILHMSGYIDRPEMQTVIRLPHFLQKPFTPAELLQKVRAALDESSAAQPSPHAPTPGPSRNKSSSE